MSLQRDGFKRKSDDTNSYPFLSTLTHISGAAAIWDAANFRVFMGNGTDPGVAGATTTDGRNMVGHFQDAWPIQSSAFGTSPPPPPFLTVRENGVWKPFGKAGETYQPRAQVVLSDVVGSMDGQHIRLFAGGDDPADIIGEVASDTPSAGITVAGDLVEIPVRLKRTTLANLA